MGLGQPGGGTFSVEDVLGGSRVGVAVAVEVSAICGGSATISIESPAARSVSIALAPTQSIVRLYPWWTLGNPADVPAPVQVWNPPSDVC